MQTTILRSAGLTLAIFLPPAICLPPMSSLAQTFSPTFEQSIVRAGADYRTFKSGPDPGSCQSSCIADSQCRAWSFEKPTCWLKNRVPLPAISPHMVSGVVRR
jgi:PAN domain